MLYALIALCLFGGASAQLMGFLTCPSNVSPMTDFNADKLKGRWYKVRKFPMVYTWFSHCPYVEFEPAGGSSLKIIHSTYYRKQKIHLKFGGRARHRADGKAGELENTVIFEKWKVDYEVLGTDYSTYVVIYSCTSLVIFHVKFLFIYTKVPDPSTSTINTAVNVVTTNKLSTKYLQTVIRDNCTEVDKS